MSDLPPPSRQAMIAAAVFVGMVIFAVAAPLLIRLWAWALR